MERQFQEKQLHGTPIFPLQVYSHHDENGFYFVPQHWHAEIEWIYVDTGVLALTIRGQSYTMHPGSFCFINSGELHEIRSFGESFHHAIVFRPSLLDFALYDICQHDFISPVTGGKVIFPAASTAFSAELKQDILFHMKSIVQLYHTRPRCMPLSVKIHLFTILERLYRSENMRLNPISSKSADSMEKLKQVLLYIEQHYPLPISLEHMAEIAYMSPNYFCHYFRKEIGKPPIAFVNEYRIQKAAQLLSESDLPVSQVAMSVGFDNFSYFIRKFKEYKSVTPKEYRNIWNAQRNT